VRTRRLRVGFFRAAWRIENAPEMMGPTRVLDRVEPDDGSFGKGCKQRIAREIIKTNGIGFARGRQGIHQGKAGLTGRFKIDRQQ